MVANGIGDYLALLKKNQCRVTLKVITATDLRLGFSVYAEHGNHILFVFFNLRNKRGHALSWSALYGVKADLNRFVSAI